jgi:alanyl-tRNA synthetase
MTGNATSQEFWSGNRIRKAFLDFFKSKGHTIVRSSSLVPHGDPTLLFTNAGMNQFKDVFLGLEKRDYDKATTAQKCVRAGGKHNDLENVGFTKRHHTFFEMMGNFSFGDYFKEKAIPYAWELVTSPEWYGIDKNKLYVTVFGGAEFGGTGIPAGAGSANVGAQHAAPQSPTTDPSVGAGFSPSPSGAATPPTRHSEPVAQAFGPEESLSGTTLGADEEARKIWLAQNVPVDRIFDIPGLKDNFWAMGDTGPCGPCSEIHYDMGPAASELGHADCKFPCDCGRYVEIWNLVFMQFNRDASGTLTPLPKPCVDTGMGLERVAAVLQGVVSNYDTDLFMPLVVRAEQLTGARHGIFEPTNASLRIVADHSRATAFLISDGVIPSNEARGYVLRKIMRRAIFHGRRLHVERPFLFEMIYAVRDLMGNAYPELAESADRVTRIVLAEEERFSHTLKVGSKELEDRFESIRKLNADRLTKAVNELGEHLKLSTETAKILDIFLAPTASERRTLLEKLVGPPHDLDVFDRIERLRADTNNLTLAGDVAFELYDTYGLPRDFIEDACRDEGFGFDVAGFERAMNEQKRRARASWKGARKEAANPAYARIAERFQTEKDFYHGTCAKDCCIEAIILTGGNRSDGKAGPVNELNPGESGEVVLDRTAIYAESGGQMADTGAFYDASESQLLAELTGAYYPVAGLVAHKVTAKETLRVCDRVTVIADAERRARIIRNHTGTHLVHAALRNILGTHVKQAGSLNAPDRLRFDFSHFAHVDPEELRDIEQQVNDEIRHNTPIETDITSLDNALASGALAFFGDKYPDANVRVVTIPDDRAPRGFYSKELCGGTHVQRIGDIGVLKIVSEGSVAAGVRRIEAVTGIGALDHFQKQAEVLTQVAHQLNVAEDSVLATVEKLSQTAKQLEKELEMQKRKGALGQLDELVAKAQTIKGVKVVVAEVPPVDREGLRQLVDSLRQKLGSGVVALGMPDDGKVALIAGVTKDLTAKVHAGKLIQTFASKLGGRGGGRPDLAEGGGTDTAGLKSALSSIPSYLEPLL